MECIKLKCSECENINCNIARLMVPKESKEGCIKKIPENLYIKYIHYINEVAPFMYKNTTREYQTKIYIEIIDLLFSIYEYPSVKKIGENGKVLISKTRI